LEELGQLPLEREQIMKTRMLAIPLILGMAAATCPAATDINPTKLPDEVRAKQVRDMRWGLFICWSFSTFGGREWTPICGKDAGISQRFCEKHLVNPINDRMALS
jgi:hypothetical protein